MLAYEARSVPAGAGRLIEAVLIRAAGTLVSDAMDRCLGTL
jgi:hypothetical protein